MEIGLAEQVAQADAEHLLPTKVPQNAEHVLVGQGVVQQRVQPRCKSRRTCRMCKKFGTGKESEPLFLVSNKKGREKAARTEDRQERRKKRGIGSAEAMQSPGHRQGR